MHKVTTQQRATVTASLLTIALIVALTAGCSQTKNWLQGRKTADAEPMILGAPETDQYISEIYRLVSGDPATQAEIFADASSAAQLTPDPSTRLRFALVLATPGHSGADPQCSAGHPARPVVTTGADDPGGDIAGNYQPAAG